jgi:hypothetical protein
MLSSVMHPFEAWGSRKRIRRRLLQIRLMTSPRARQWPVEEIQVS